VLVELADVVRVKEGLVRCILGESRDSRLADSETELGFEFDPVVAGVVTPVEVADAAVELYAVVPVS
jgi:hypothetical protein